MEKPHILIAVDALDEMHITALTTPFADWATWERIPEDTTAELYTAKLSTAEIVIGWPEPQWLANSPSVRLLLCPSVGYESYQGYGLEVKPNFTFCNAGMVYSEGVAEHCVAMMMALTRRLPAYVRGMQSKTWHQQIRHELLAGKTVCIVGLGSIGTAVARRCAALGMTVTGVRRNPNHSSPHVDKIFSSEHLSEAVTDADHVIVALPGGKSTKHLFNRPIFEAMKNGAYFFNVGRGSVVDEPELIAQLQNGHLAGVGLDVFETEPLPDTSLLWAMDNVIVTPHMAGYTADYADELIRHIMNNLQCYRLGKPLPNRIDLGRNNS